MYIRVSLRGMLMLIRIDTLRRVHNLGFLAGRLILFPKSSTYIHKYLTKICFQLYIKKDTNVIQDWLIEYCYRIPL